jgi:hypothetical protein
VDEGMALLGSQLLRHDRGAHDASASDVSCGEGEGGRRRRAAAGAPAGEVKDD